MFKLNADTDEARRTGLERAIYKYGIIICTCESSILLHLKKRDLIVSRLTLTTGQRAYQVKARKGSTRMPLVILASVKYHTWDREMHDLLAQVGLQEKVVPVLVDVFPEQEKLSHAFHPDPCGLRGRQPTVGAHCGEGTTAHKNVQ